MFRGTVYRDIASDDPELPEILRMMPPSEPSDGASNLQRSMSLVSIGQPTDSSPPEVSNSPVQNMSVSDEETSWADQMQQESDDRKVEKTDLQGTVFIGNRFYFRWLKILLSIFALVRIFLIQNRFHFRWLKIILHKRF